MYARIGVAFIYQIEKFGDNIVRLKITCQQGDNQPSVTVASEAPDGFDDDATQRDKATIAYVNAKSSSASMLSMWERGWKTNQPYWLVVVGPDANCVAPNDSRAYMVCGMSDFAEAVDTFFSQSLHGQSALAIQTSPAEILALKPEPGPKLVANSSAHDTKH